MQLGTKIKCYISSTVHSLDLHQNVRMQSLNTCDGELCYIESSAAGEQEFLYLRNIEHEFRSEQRLCRDAHGEE